MLDQEIRAILFDLDGTLADTAPDLAAALNAVRSAEGQPPLPFELLRPQASRGVRGLIDIGFGLSPEAPGYAELAERVLERYAANLCVHTRLFDGMSELLDRIEQSNLPWGIVTNKHSRYTTPLIEALGLHQRAACVVSGDTAARPKPAPDPLLYACASTGLTPSTTVYVGDDLRDIQAGAAAGMPTIAAAYGYLGDSGPIEQWGADAITHHPMELLALLG